MVKKLGVWSLTGLTVKTLRFYHQQGLLVPTCVDDQTGYRYYDASRVELARVIAQLRDLNFPLSEIAEILRHADDEADILQHLIRQRDANRARLERSREIDRQLSRIILKEQEARAAMQAEHFEVVEKQLDPMVIAGVRMKGKYCDCGKGFGRIGRHFGRHIRGKPMLLMYDTEYREDDADFEACMPVSGARDAEGISVRELPGGKCVTLLHKGHYEELGRSYEKILAYAREHGYDVIRPTREVYIKGPGMIFKGNPKNYLTEIQLLVTPRES